MPDPSSAERALRLLAFGAHPDDLEFGCGGILLNEAARGSQIGLCLCSRGEAASNGTPAERETEARRAAEMLGAQAEFLELGGDCHLEETPPNAIEMARRIRAHQPDIVLAPVSSPNQHPDHIVVGRLCETAARFARYGGLNELRDQPPHRVKHLLAYAVTPSAAPKAGAVVRVDISGQFERWVQLMECHQTQLRTRNYIELQTARARLLGIEAGVEYAQALYAADDFLVGALADLPPAVRLF